MEGVNMKKVTVVTGSRAEWGLLENLTNKLCNDFIVDVVATGSHLSPRHGMTVKEIKGPFQLHQVEIVLSNDSPVAISKSMGLAMISIGEIYERIKPDLIVILGDRHEIACAACCGVLFNIPIAHIHGGESSLGSYDEVFRNICTMAASLHFPAAEPYLKKIVQMVRYPNYIHCVGTLGCEGLTKRKSEDVKDYLIIIWNSETTGDHLGLGQLLAVIRKQNKNIIFILPGYDKNTNDIKRSVNRFIETYQGDCWIHPSLKRNEYLNLLKGAIAIVGNSSSGIIEAPALGVPTINIGRRQEGRLTTPSIIRADSTVDSIQNAFDQLQGAGFQALMKENYDCPYKGGNVAEKITHRIKMFLKSGE